MSDDARHDETERLRSLLEVGRALTSELELDSVLQLVLETARELCGASYAALGVLDADRRELAQFLTLGESPEVRRGIGHLPTGRGVLGVLIDDPRPLRLPDVGAHPESYGFPPGHPPMRSFLGVPILVRGAAWGNLYLTEKQGADRFSESDLESIVVLAQWAAIAIDNAHSVEARRLRDTLAAAEGERGRWARELHDQTLQGLGGIKLALAAALRRAPAEQDPGRGDVEKVVDQLTDEIRALRAIIADLRPVALDELGLEPALRTLAETVASRGGLRLDLDLALGDRRLAPELETIAYRVAQEAMSNVLKHAGARTLRLRAGASADGDEIVVEVLDDGSGFDPERRTTGYGVLGMRERAELGGGSLTVTDARPGTAVRLSLPAAR